MPVLKKFEQYYLNPETVIRSGWDAIKETLPNRPNSLDALQNFIATRGLTKTDDTGSVQVGSQGLTVTRTKPNREEDWSLSVDPSMQSARFNKGNFNISGNWNKFDPRVKFGFNTSNNKSFYDTGFNSPEAAVDSALRPYEQNYSERRSLTPKEQLDIQIENRKQQDPNWYRP